MSNELLEQWNITASKKRTESLEVIKSEAENGDPIARYLMGERYYTGTGVKQDLKKAISYFMSSGWHGYVPAQFRLATLFFEQPDYFKKETGGRMMTAAEKGLACLEKVFLRNSATRLKTYLHDDDIFKLHGMIGDEVTKFRDNETAFKEAFRWLWNAAKQGNPVVLLALGNWFKEIDEEEAKKWYRKAAEQGDPNTQLEIGDFFLKFDKEEAAGWYRKAAERAEQYVQLETGDHFPDFDKEEAARWFQNAADGDDPQALMGEWFIDLGRRFIDLDNEEATKWFRKAAQLKDDPETQTILGEWFLDIDENEAKQWFRKAAERGDPYAMEYLSDLLKDKDGKEAEQWRRKAAEAAEQ